MSNKTVTIHGYREYDSMRTEVHVDESEVCAAAVRIALRIAGRTGLPDDAYIAPDGVWEVHHDGHHGGYKTQHGTATAKERDDWRAIEAFACIVGVRYDV